MTPTADHAYNHRAYGWVWRTILAGPLAGHYDHTIQAKARFRIRAAPAGEFISESWS
ncbi:MAG: hypothetical protein HY978_00165 [Candidatus Liptonbacteria bacterium]|nr:hypothetical protein [Candidatus Liptonbacteria bacterium]